MASSESRGISLQWQMLVGFLVGLVFGLIANATAGDAAWVEWISTYITGPIGQIFLRLIFMMVIPLLISALIVGIAARIRESSVTWPSCNGTLKSTRTKTRLPATSASRMVCLFIGQAGTGRRAATCATRSATRQL